MDLLSLPGVFAPISDSRMLADAIDREPIRPQSKVLDLCTGSGVLALAAARRGATVTATDISRRAVLTVRLNAARHRLRLRTRRGHLFRPVDGEHFDLVVSNPPYVPSPEPELPARGAARAWAAGRDGRAFLDEICDEAPRFLVTSGVLLLVQSSLVGVDLTLELLTEPVSPRRTSSDASEACSVHSCASSRWWARSPPTPRRRTSS